MSARRATSQPKDIAERVSLAPKAPKAPKAQRPAPTLADDTHVGRASPAQLLQLRLEMALREPAPAVDRWSGRVRLMVLLGMTAGSWAVILGVGRLIFH